MSANLDVLAVGAHPDDVEVHVGGLLALASRRGLKAGILDLTGGELGTRGDVATRRAEALRAAAILGVPRTLLDLPDGRFDEDEGHRAKVMAVLRELRPEVLILPSPEDRHPDHRRAHRLVSEAAFCAGLRNYPDPAAPGRPFPGEPWRPAAIAWVGGENPGPPDLVVDVSDVWATRMEAFDAFGSQFTADPSQALTRIAHPAFRRGVEGRAMHWGSLITVDAAEALWCAKPVPQALLRLLERLR